MYIVFLQLFTNGLSLGILYGIIALGFGLIVTTTGVFHIAHSATFLMGGSIFFILFRSLSIPLAVSIAITLVGAALLGLTIDKTIYLPITRRGGGMFTVFIASLGVSLIFEALVLLLFHGIPIVARIDNLTSFSLGSINIRWLDVIISVIGFIVYLCIYLWLFRTKMGLAIRGLADNPTLSSFFVDAAQFRSVVFMVGSAWAGLGGIIAAYDSGITPTQGFDALFISIVALIVGGMRNVVLGTLIGGMTLGLVKVCSGYFVPQWFYFFVFLTLVLSIIIWPEGLVGRMKK